jgi:putative membrane protein
VNTIVTYLRGVAIGIANIIPGVSGGTMALVLGIYERLIGALNNISLATVKALLSALTFKKPAIDALKDELRRIDAWFLILLGAGAGTAIVASAKLITWLLERQHDPTYGLFCGLVLVSILVPVKMMKKFGALPVAAAIVACALTVGLGMSMSAEDHLKAQQQKLELKQAGGDTAGPQRFTTDPVKLVV